MPIVLPTSYSTYGDSTTTEGPLRKYVLSQFRADADLEWVKQLRAAMVRDEVKYRDIVAMRPALRANKLLWGRVENGVAQATIVIIDPRPIDEEVRDLTVLQRRELHPNKSSPTLTVAAPPP